MTEENIWAPTPQELEEMKKEKAADEKAEIMGLFRGCTVDNAAATPEAGSSPQTIDQLFDGITEIKKVSMKPGDTLVVRHPGRLKKQQRMTMIDSLKRKFPGIDAIVLDEGMEIGVIEKGIASEENTDTKPREPVYPNNICELH